MAASCRFRDAILEAEKLQQNMVQPRPSPELSIRHPRRSVLESQGLATSHFAARFSNENIKTGSVVIIPNMF